MLLKVMTRNMEKEENEMETCFSEKNKIVLGYLRWGQNLLFKGCSIVITVSFLETCLSYHKIIAWAWQSPIWLSKIV